MKQELSWRLVDNLKRQLYIKFELKKILLKFIYNSININSLLKIYSKYKLVLLPKFSLIIQQNNRCIQTGRVFNVLKFNRYSRFVFRYNSNFLLIPGIKRKSW